MSDGAQNAGAQNSNSQAVEVQCPLLVGLKMGIEVGQPPDDAATCVQVEGHGLFRILRHSEERRENRIERQLKVNHRRNGVVGDAPEVVAVVQLKMQVGILAAVVVVPVSRIKVGGALFKTLAKAAVLGRKPVVAVWSALAASSRAAKLGCQVFLLPASTCFFWALTSREVLLALVCRCSWLNMRK